MRHWKRAMVLLSAVLCLFFLSGCADQFSVAVFTTGGGEPAADAGNPPAERDAPGESPEPAGKPEVEPEREPAPENFLETLPRMYMFCSGAGGWSTELTLEADGSFTGLYHDSDMGAADPEKFPDGTRYICNFSGKFTQPVKVDETTYSMQIESLELEHPADRAEEYADGVRYIYSGPYGLEDAEEVRIYLPDSPADTLPEGVLWAVRGPYDWEATEEGTLGVAILYNVSGEQGFVQYPLKQPNE